MANRLLLLTAWLFIGTDISAQAISPARKYWLAQMDKMARPVLSNLAEDRLKQVMPVELSITTDHAEDRKSVSYLEALGRTFSGIAPFLNGEGGSKQELELRDQYRRWTLKAIANAVDSAAKDHLRWNGGQPLVDAAFLALGLVRSPWIWEHLDPPVKEQVIKALRTTRATIPAYSNWLLFSGMIEAFFCKYGYEYDAVRIEYGIQEFANHWYVGDGFFSDGMHFHMDYYNSIVIHPFLATIVQTLNINNKSYERFAGRLAKISKRYAEIQERSINTDGTYPIVGRSIVYRGGVFHQLADMALRKQLPSSLKPAQVRAALTAVIRKTMDALGSYNREGWLAIGVHGAQPELADTYITTGSLYICSNIFLPLGLPDTDEFWSAPDEPWTAMKVWGGQGAAADHALDLDPKE
jgi:hypothetical protein